jgi:hypothetical protein
MYGARICLVPSLRTYPRSTSAWVHLPSCVPSLLTASSWVGSPPEGDSPLATMDWYGRVYIGTGISTGCARVDGYHLASIPSVLSGETAGSARARNPARLCRNEAVTQQAHGRRGLRRTLVLRKKNLFPRSTPRYGHAGYNASETRQALPELPSRRAFSRRCDGGEPMLTRLKKILAGSKARPLTTTNHAPDQKGTDARPDPAAEPKSDQAQTLA